MAVAVNCPRCRSLLHFRDDAAGKEMSCPRCQAPVMVPSAAEPVMLEAVAELVPERRPAGPTRRCPECGEPVAVTARKCRHCKAWIEDDDDDDRGPQYKPCPRCGARGAERVVFTFWGSFYGPALLTHVRCPECGTAYNGKTGRSNLIPAIIFVTIPALLIVGVIGGLAAWLYHLMRL